MKDSESEGKIKEEPEALEEMGLETPATMEQLKEAVEAMNSSGFKEPKVRFCCCDNLSGGS